MNDSRPVYTDPEAEKLAQAPAEDTAWEQEHKPTLSEEEWRQDLPPEQLRAWMRWMLLGRRFEEKAAEAYAIGKIGGFCHLYIGEEAVAVGALAAVRPDDPVIAPYREHVHALVRGVPPAAVMAELFGRVDGCSRGKGGSMHLFSREQAFYGGHGIVGAQIPLGVGLAWAIKYRGEDRVALVFLGEAAVNQGAWHEALNMAALWKLPVVLVVENNRFGMGTAWERVSPVLDISQKGCPYGIPGAVADGMDVLDVYRVVKAAVDHARGGAGPFIVEARTYRFVGHSMSDPVYGVYRTKEDVERERQRDPIRVFADRLASWGVLDQAGLEALDAEVRAEVEQAVAEADRSPEPELAEIYRDVYATPAVHGWLFLDGQEHAR